MPPSTRFLHISEKAEGDYFAILQESIRGWGVEQAARYREALDLAMNRLLSFPEMGKRVPHLLEGGCSVRTQHHLIYYTYTDQVVTIHRILHERRNVTAALLADAPE